MRIQDFIADQTLTSATQLSHFLRKTPEDKQSWKPMDEGRTALDQVAECAVIGGHLVGVLQTHVMPEFTPEFHAQYEKDTQALDTADKAIDLLMKSTGELAQVIRQIPDADLEKRIQFWGPEPWSMAEIAGHHRYNMVYHIGQIGYIQTLLGDKSMD